MKQKSPQFVDVIVGNNIRRLRNLHKISQEKLGDVLGITFQQIQKYEKGANRVGASRLQAICSHFGVSISTLFEGADDGTSKGVVLPQLSSKAIEVAMAFDQITDQQARTSVFNVIKAIVQSNLAPNAIAA